MEQPDLGPCDEWEGRSRVRDYGTLWLGGKNFLAHRLVWMQEHGHTDLNILHLCDNPRCIRLDHLFAGSQAENMRDMAAKGRHGMQRHRAEARFCKRGHEYTPENTYVRPSQPNKRVCRECSRIQYRAWYHRSREAA